MSKAPYLLQCPKERTSSVVFSSPHSGRVYPDSLVASSVLDPHMLRSSEDAYVDTLFSGVTAHGAPLLSAVFPRAWVDLNRREDELDPALIADVPRGQMNPRVASGLGVIPRVVAGGRCIYRGKLARSEAASRISVFWKPYHKALAQLLDEAHAATAAAVLIDCHSMPHEALQSTAAHHQKLPDIVLGDRFGASAAADLVSVAEAAFRAEGFTVSRNIPFAGAYITQHYGKPSAGRHALQVEIDRSLYMNEQTMAKRAAFDEISRALVAASSKIAAWGGDARDAALPLAAE